MGIEKDFELSPVFYGVNQNNDNEIIYIPGSFIAYGLIFPTCDSTDLKYLIINNKDDKLLLDIIDLGLKERTINLESLERKRWEFEVIWVPINLVNDYNNSIRRKRKNAFNQIFKVIYSTLVNLEYSEGDFEDDYNHYKTGGNLENILDSSDESYDEFEDDEDEDDYNDNWWRIGESPYGEAW